MKQNCGNCKHAGEENKEGEIKCTIDKKFHKSTYKCGLYDYILD